MTDDNFDNKTNNDLIDYATKEEIANIISSALNENSLSIQNRVIDKVITKLNTSAVTFLIGIIVTVFVIFKVLDNAIVTTKENIELKAQVEKLQLQLEKQKFRHK